MSQQNIDKIDYIYHKLKDVQNSFQTRIALQVHIADLCNIITEQERRIEALEKFNEETYG